jgi:hypothetical protein
MCDSCWRDAGSPTERTPDTARLVELIGKLYEIHATGGPLHSVLDDWNLDTAVIEPYYDGWRAEDLDALWYGDIPFAELDPLAPAVVERLGVSTRALCDEIAALLNAMTVTQRISALAYADGFAS